MLGEGGESTQIRPGIDRSAALCQGEIMTTSNAPSSAFGADRDQGTPVGITRSLLGWGVLAGRSMSQFR